MRRALLIVMLDVLVLSVLTLSSGNNQGQMPLLAANWSNIVEKSLKKEQAYREQLAKLESAASSAQKLAAENAAKLQSLANASQAERAGLQEKLKLAELAAKQAAAKNKELAEATQNTQKDIGRLAAERDSAITQAQEREKALTQAKEAEKQAAAALTAKAQALAELEKKLADIQNQEASAAKMSQQTQAELQHLSAREQEARERFQQAQAAIEAMTIKMQTAAEAANNAQLRAAVAESQLAESRRLEKQLTDYEKEAIAKARQEETAAKVQAATVTAELQAAKKEAKTTQDFIILLKKNLADANSHEAKVREEMERLTSEKEEIKEQLSIAQGDNKRSVWTRREKAIRRLQVKSIELNDNMRAVHTDTASVLFLPLLKIGDQTCLPAEFASLNLDCWDIQHGATPTILAYAIDAIQANRAPNALQKPMIIGANEPRIVYLPIAEPNSDDAVEPIGIQRLKERRVQWALLFKKEYPDESISIEITPALVGDYLIVKSTDPNARIKARPGDYLMTENGEFIGIMVTKDRCYVLPNNLPAEGSRHTIPIAIQGNDNNYRVFIQAAKNVKGCIDKLAAK